MDWKTMLSYISGCVDEELLLRNEYLVAENRVLRNQLQGSLASDRWRTAVSGRVRKAVWSKYSNAQWVSSLQLSKGCLNPVWSKYSNAQRVRSLHVSRIDADIEGREAA